jgi:hypothetical protein
LASDIATAARAADRLQTAPGAIDGGALDEGPAPSLQLSNLLRRRIRHARPATGRWRTVCQRRSCTRWWSITPATGARLQPAGQLDDGDELVVLIDASVGQHEPGARIAEVTDPKSTEFDTRSAVPGRCQGQSREDEDLHPRNRQGCR